MDPDTARGIIAALPALLKPPPITEPLRDLITLLLTMVLPPPEPMMDVKHRLFPNAFNVWEGRDVFAMLCQHQYIFSQVTGETPESLSSMVYDIHWIEDKPHKLSYLNRILLVVLWLRSYPSYHMLSMLFNISVTNTCFNTAI